MHSETEKRACSTPTHSMCTIFGIGAGIALGIMMKKRMYLRHHGMAPWRRFWTREEKLARLEEYLKQLQMEEKAVQEKMDYIRQKAAP